MAKKAQTAKAEKKSIFWIMQYSSPFKDVYKKFKQKLSRNYRFIDPLENKNQTAILAKIIPQIIAADFVIADVSTIGYDASDDNRPLFNGNVMFELGVAMAYRKNLIMISSATRKGLPFDISGYHVNDYVEVNIDQFVKEIKAILDDQETVYSNPVSDLDRTYTLIKNSELEALKSASLATPNTMQASAPSLDQLIAEDPHGFIRDFGNRRGREIYREYITPEKLSQETLKGLEALTAEERAAFASLFDGIGAVVQSGKIRIEGLDYPAFGVPAEEAAWDMFSGIDSAKISILQNAGVLHKEKSVIHRHYGPQGGFTIHEIRNMRDCTREIYSFVKKYQQLIPLLGQPASNQGNYFATGKVISKFHEIKPS